MKRIILFILLLPLISASTINETILINEKGINFTITVLGEIYEEQKEIDLCTNFSFTGLPSISEHGEKISYGFTGWKEGDEVTYWIENVSSEYVKDPHTTTSSAKKSYTPKIEKEEQILLFKAERQREECEPIHIEQIVGIYGGEDKTICEETICAEPEPCNIPEQIASLYVRAKNYKEKITLYGRVEETGEYLLFGEETLQIITLEEESFNQTIHPKKGENTYGLVAVTGGIPQIITFNLIFEEIENISTNNTNPINNTSINNSYSVPAITGGIIIEDNQNQTNTTLLLSITGIVGIGLFITAIKTKILRSKHDSA